MSLTLSNQKPAVLDPVHTIAISGDYDPISAVKATLIDPVFVPLNPNGTVSLSDSKGNSFDADDLSTLLMHTMQDQVNTTIEKQVKEVYQQALVSYDKSTPLLVNEVFAVQAAGSQRPALPHPGPNTMYTAASDVLPAAKKMLAGQDPHGSEFFASLAYTYSPETLGFWFQTEDAFTDFTNWLTQQAQTLSTVLPQNTTNLLNRFAQTKLKTLTESIILRASDTSENEEYSFARTLIHLLMSYQRQQAATPAATGANTAPNTPVTGVLPFVVSELFLPRTLVLVNVEAHARTTSRKIDNEWRLINASIASPIKVVSNKSISKLTALPRAMAKAAAQAANAQSNKQQINGRAAKIIFRKQPPTSVNIIKGVLKVIKGMKEVNRSQNVFKKSKSSFVKANRRNPDDYNKPGKLTSTHYLPDLHVYLDTSGSISEDNYQQAVIMLIQMAKKMNVNLYFSSFSHQLSQEVMLKTANKSVAQIWKEFRNIPKVTGGTDYKQIWDYINASAKRTERFSLIVTDFEWSPRNQRLKHPRNLYYAPCANMDWNQMTHAAKYFSDQMQHIDPGIARRMIGMTL